MSKHRKQKLSQPDEEKKVKKEKRNRRRVHEGACKDEKKSMENTKRGEVRIQKR